MRQISIRSPQPYGAAEIIRWHYPLPYDFYDQTSNGEEAVNHLLQPEYNYHAMEDQAGLLIGFFCLGPDGQVPGWEYNHYYLDLGMGLAPALLGRGVGGTCLQAILEYLRTGGVPLTLRATVAAWNQRAIRLCSRAGFCEIASFEAPSRCCFKILVLNTA